MQPLSQGIVVDRHFEITQPITTANVGDVISITLRVVITRELQHALFELPLPAGTEPVDLRLATESPNLVDNPALGRTWTTADGFSAESQRLWPTHVDPRDDRIALFVTNLPPGRYYITLPIRATTPGHYRVLPAYAEMMYARSVMGYSAGAALVIRP